MIPIGNLYYMLCYAWRRLPDAGIGGVQEESGRDLAEMFARFLTHGVLRLARRGLGRGYENRMDALAVLRGRGLWFVTERRRLRLTGRVMCEYQELSADTPANRVLKAALTRLADVADLDHELSSRVRACLSWLTEVTPIDLSRVTFGRIQLDGSLREYAWLLDACRLLARWSLPADGGVTRFREVERDEAEMARLFEEFVRGFYRLERPGDRVGRSRLVWPWMPADEHSRSILPGMTTDVTLVARERVVVIEAKYKGQTLTAADEYRKSGLHSPHLYQLHAYLTALVARGVRQPRGILVYPWNGTRLAARFCHADYVLEARTVDLRAPWREIRGELLEMVS